MWIHSITGKTTMPRKRPPQQVIAILPADLADRVRAQAQQEGRSISNYVKKVLAEQFPPTQLELPLDAP